MRLRDHVLLDLRVHPRKLKTAGKRAYCTLSVQSKAVGKGLVPDQLKRQACVGKMMAAFTKAEGAAGDCTATRDAGAIGDKIDAATGPGY